jgi:hypothetical protein
VIAAGEDAHAGAARRNRRRSAALLTALAVAWIAGRYAIVGAYASDLPSWDDWDAFGRTVLVPLHAGNFAFDALVAAHNEHRIALSRLWSLLVYLANERQWDNGVQAVANVLPAVLAWLALCALALQAVRGAAARFLVVGAASAALLAPHGWENSLYGLQSAFYWAALLAVVAFAAVERAERSRLALAVAIAAAWASLFTIATGLLVAAIALGSVVAAWAGERLSRGRAAIGAAACTAALAAGIALAVHVPGHDVLRAGDAATYLSALGTIASWPGPPVVIPALLWWTPALVAAVAMLRGRLADPSAHSLVLVAGWALANVLAIAYARGAEQSIGVSAEPDWSSCRRRSTAATSWISSWRLCGRRQGRNCGEAGRPPSALRSRKRSTHARAPRPARRLRRTGAFQPFTAPAARPPVRKRWM